MDIGQALPRGRINDQTCRLQKRGEGRFGVSGIHPVVRVAGRDAQADAPGANQFCHAREHLRGCERREVQQVRGPVEVRGLGLGVVQQHDAAARYTGKLLERRLQLDVMYGFHYQGQHIEPANKGEASFVYFADRADPYSLSDFEDVPECRRQPLPGGSMSNPCPLTQYRRGGYGPYSLTVLLRHQLLASATMFVSAGGRHNPLRGTHALKLGADFEYLSYDNNRFSTGPDLDPGDPFSGHTTWQTSPDGLRLRRAQQYGVRAADGSGERLDSYRSETSTRNVSLYLRDSWTVGFVPGLVVNAGLRWEAQEIFDQLGNRQVGIYDNLAPRIGITYDATGKGRPNGFDYAIRLMRAELRDPVERQRERSDHQHTVGQRAPHGLESHLRAGVALGTALSQQHRPRWWLAGPREHAALPRHQLHHRHPRHLPLAELITP